MSTLDIGLKPRKPPEPRPDKSPEAIAERRELHRQSLADSALEGCEPDPRAAHIHEAWILGELTSEEGITMLKAFLSAKAAR